MLGPGRQPTTPDWSPPTPSIEVTTGISGFLLGWAWEAPNFPSSCDCANFLAVCFWSSDLIPLSPSLHLQRGKLILSRTSVWVEGQACAQGIGCTDAWHARARSLQSLVPCARRFAAWSAVQREPAEPRDPSRVG